MQFLAASTDAVNDTIGLNNVCTLQLFSELENSGIKKININTNNFNYDIVLQENIPEDRYETVVNDLVNSLNSNSNTYHYYWMPLHRYIYPLQPITFRKEDGTEIDDFAKEWYLIGIRTYFSRNDLGVSSNERFVYLLKDKIMGYVRNGEKHTFIIDSIKQVQKYGFLNQYIRLTFGDYIWRVDAMSLTGDKRTQINNDENNFMFEFDFGQNMYMKETRFKIYFNKDIPDQYIEIKVPYYLINQYDKAYPVDIIKLNKIKTLQDESTQTIDSLNEDIFFPYFHTLIPINNNYVKQTDVLYIEPDMKMFIEDEQVAWTFINESIGNDYKIIPAMYRFEKINNSDNTPTNYSPKIKTPFFGRYDYKILPEKGYYKIIMKYKLHNNSNEITCSSAFLMN